MYFTTHAAVGALAGAAVGGRLWGFLAGCASHAILDIFPHHDYTDTVHGVLDVAIGTTLLFGLAYGHPAFIFGALGAVLPDLEVASNHILGTKLGLFPSHSGAVPHGRPLGLWGFLVQVPLAAVSFWLASLL